MTENTEAIKAILDRCSETEKRVIAEYIKNYTPKHSLEKQWDVDAGVILSAVERAPDLTQRGVRGIIAEAFFAARMISNPPKGWTSVPLVGNPAYDAFLQNGVNKISIQVKLQRRLKGEPMKARKEYPEHFVVEVQKTRGGVNRSTGEATRPYRFGEFDIIAVNMHPSTGKWERFMYTVAAWLLPRVSDPKLIEIFQPVSPVRNDDWTDDLEECIRWHLSGVKRTICQTPPGCVSSAP
jgi:hypothetical protein